MDIQPAPVAIVGAGLSGLTCAHYLHQAGVPVRLYEKTGRTGGRVATDVVDGFRLDHGFQVFLTAYPEAQMLLDYDALDLHPFYDGALVRLNDAFHRLADPIRHPGSAPATLLAPVGTLGDKLRVARLRNRLRADSLDALFGRPEITTEEALLNRWSLSHQMIEPFFRPFFGGITLNPSLSTSSRVFEFLFRMFAEGQAALPAQGMQAIPDQIKGRLPPDCIQLNAEVKTVNSDGLTLADSTHVKASAVVIATEAPAAQALHPGAAVTLGAFGEVCFYYAAPTPPITEPLLVLNADDDGPVNNMTVLSNAAPGYAPPGQALISAVVLGNPNTLDDALERDVRAQLARWFGENVQAWRHLRTFRIAYGLPDQSPPYLAERDRAVQLESGVFRCGDHLATASINGALRTGRRAAEAVRAALA